MIRKWIVKNFFSDLMAEHSAELNKALLKRNRELLHRMSKLEFPDNDGAISELQGRIFSEEECKRIVDIARIGCRPYAKMVI